MFTFVVKGFFLERLQTTFGYRVGLIKKGTRMEDEDQEKRKICGKGIEKQQSDVLKGLKPKEFEKCETLRIPLHGIQGSSRRKKCSNQQISSRSKFEEIGRKEW